jgi:hypothetical protein
MSQPAGQQAGQSPPPPQPQQQQPSASIQLNVTPLALRVLSNRRPETGLAAHRVDCAEEGDILFGVLHPALARAPPKKGGAPPADDFGAAAAVDLLTAVPGPLPTLTYPATDMKHFMGEYFRATLVFRNNAANPISAWALRVEVQNPQGGRTAVTPEANRAPMRLDASASLEVRVEHLLRMPGAHQLSVAAEYADVMGETHRLNRNFTVVVERGIEECTRQVVHLPDWAPDARVAAHFDELMKASFATGDAAGSFGEAPGPVSPSPLRGRGRATSFAYASQLAAAYDPVTAEKFLVSIGLENTSGSAVMLGDVKFTPSAANQGHGVVVAPPPRPEHLAKKESADVAATLMNMTDAHVERTHQLVLTNNSGAADVADALFQPREIRHFVFEVYVTPKASSSLLLAIQAQQASSSAAAKAASAAAQLEVELGRAQWEWRRANGDGGTAATTSFTLAQPLRRPEVVLRPLAVTPYPTVVNRPCAFTFAAVSAAAAALDLVVTVNSERLLPNFLYAGPTRVSIGVVEPGGSVTFSLENMVALRPGVSVVPESAMELRDAGALDAVLWPTAANAPLPPHTQTAMRHDVGEGAHDSRGLGSPARRSHSAALASVVRVGGEFRGPTVALLEAYTVAAPAAE